MYTTIHHIGLVPYHKYQDIDVVPTTCARICSLTSLARKRTAFYAYSERQHEPYAKMTALRSLLSINCSTTAPVQP